MRGLFRAAPATAPSPAPSRGRATPQAIGDQEARVLDEFGRTYGIQFRDMTLLKLALTHRSYLHVTGQGPRESNERLEFLGDSVLGLVTSEFLYRANPTEHEGQLTKTKSLLVSKAILSRRALAMGLGRFVLMSHSEVESGGRQRLSILADAFESVIGAVYLDQGFETAREFIERWLLRESRVIAADKRHTNYKSHLQEYVQSTFRTHPVYRIRSEMGPDHSKQFMVEVMVGRRVLGEGRGRNKKEAEQAAARNALERVENGPISDRDSKRDDRTAVRPARGGAPASTSRVSEMESHVLPEPDLGESELSEDDDESGDRPRRRRGRRGGRGRRERGGEASPPAVTPAPAPVVGTAAATPVREPRARVAGTTVISPRPEPRRPARAAQEPPAPPRVELEPVPPAYEEDENEEIGRPEGTLAEWRESPSRPATTRPVPPAEWERAPERRPVEAPEAVAAGRDEIEDEFVESPLQPRRREVPVATPEREPEFEAEPEPVFEVEPERESAPRLAEEEFADEDVSPRYPEVEPPRATPPAPAAPAAPQWGRRSRRGR